MAIKNEYDGVIANMDLRWEGETVIAEERDEALSRFSKMVWAFQRSLSRPFSNLDDKAEFQAKLYKNIDPKTAKAIIASTHCPNNDIHKISIFVTCLLIHF